MFCVSLFAVFVTWASMVVPPSVVISVGMLTSGSLVYGLFGLNSEFGMVASLGSFAWVSPTYGLLGLNPGFGVNAPEDPSLFFLSLDSFSSLLASIEVLSS